MVDLYIPETLEECAQHYLPPIWQYVSCNHFGNSDGMSGGCQWCREMTPYQWEMCQDEDLLRRLMKQTTAHPARCSYEEAVEYITKYKQNTWRYNHGNLTVD